MSAESNVARLPSQREVEGGARRAVGEARYERGFAEGYGLPPSEARRLAVEGSRHLPP